MKWAIGKWLTQAVLGCLLSILVYVCLWFLVDDEPAPWVWALLPIGSTVGIVLGDLSAYKGRRPSVLIIGMTYGLSLVGLLVGWPVAEMLYRDIFPSRMGEVFIIMYSICLLGLVMPALIGYNILSSVKRRRDSKKRVNGEG